MAQLTIDLDIGQDFSITSSKPRHHVFPFSAIGRPSMNSKLPSFDTGAVLMHLSTIATWMFWTLESQLHRDRKTNICVLNKSHLPKEEAGRIQRAYVELCAAKLIVRIAPHTYLMNPAAMLPEFSQCETVWLHWEKARTSKNLPI
jgi:hypothetical protein